MIGLFLITHSSYGESLIQCACHVLNSRPVQMAQLGVSGQDDPLDLLPLARRWLSVVDSGEGVLLLTDIFGATPSNLALKLCEPGKVEAVAGVNLPMLLRTLTYRERETLPGLVNRAVSGGRDGVMDRQPPRLRGLAGAQRPAHQRQEHHGRDDAGRGQGQHYHDRNRRCRRGCRHERAGRTDRGQVRRGRMT